MTQTSPLPLSPPARVFGTAARFGGPFSLCRLCRDPFRGHSRSDKHAAVLRPQSTRPKDRRVYTPLTGNPAEPAEGKRAAEPGSSPEYTGRRGQGQGRSLSD